MSTSQTDISARLKRLEGASPDLNPVELRTNPSDGNFACHAVPTQVTAPLVTTRPSITADIDNVTSLLDDPLELQKAPNCLELIAIVCSTENTVNLGDGNFLASSGVERAGVKTQIPHNNNINTKAYMTDK